MIENGEEKNTRRRNMRICSNSKPKSFLDFSGYDKISIDTLSKGIPIREVGFLPLRRNNVNVETCRIPCRGRSLGPVTWVPRVRTAATISTAALQQLPSQLHRVNTHLAEVRISEETCSSSSSAPCSSPPPGWTRAHPSLLPRPSRAPPPPSPPAAPPSPPPSTKCARSTPRSSRGT